jgi:hypothetical protein
MYTRKQFGQELKKRIKQQQSVVDIGMWAYDMYYEHICDIDTNFSSFLISLSAMEEGLGFERSYEELDQIADRLIAGEDVKL